MLKSCLPYLGSPKCVDNNESRNKEMELRQNNSDSFDSTVRSNRIFVRVVHAGGRVDHYPNAVLASKLLEKLPAGKWLTRPEVFKQPHESILGPEEYLLPGHKYYVVPLSTINKLKKKYSKIPGNRMKQVERRSQDQDVTSDASSTVEAADYQSEEFIDDSFRSASEFYARNEARKSTSSASTSASTSTSTSTRGNGNGSRKGGRILVSHVKPKTCSGYTWEPGLTSIKELSP